MLTIEGNIVDIFNQTIFFGTLIINDKKISAIEKISEEKPGRQYILPGFIDSHVHVESSMLVPSEFARLAVVHGTTGTISDPHEIANVCGMEGVRYMIENSKTVPFKFHFGAPSCVPATVFETAGAALNAGDVEELLQHDDIYYLSEMMNFPGVLQGDEQVMLKVAAAKAVGKPIDGHSPGLRGQDARRYIETGISTDHECFTEEEAAEKLAFGMKILIREGSAAKNFDALIKLLADHPNEMMFCSDDKHPDSLADGHINQLCARAVAAQIPLFNVLQAACINPVLHYNMRNGLLRVGDAADFVLIEDLQHFKVKQTWIHGICVAKDGTSLLEPKTAGVMNHFADVQVNLEDLILKVDDATVFPVIEALDGQLITTTSLEAGLVKNGVALTDVSRDILKIVVVNRYKQSPPAIGFIKNFGLRQGAIASTVAHDSHNIVAIGCNDAALLAAIQLLINAKGGISAVSENVASLAEQHVLPLPVAGLMSNKNGYEVARAYTQIVAFVKNTLGCTLTAPFMTLSFMALLVIPEIKISDKGMFNGKTFSFF